MILIAGGSGFFGLTTARYLAGIGKEFLLIGVNPMVENA